MAPTSGEINAKVEKAQGPNGRDADREPAPVVVVGSLESRSGAIGRSDDKEEPPNRAAARDQNNNDEGSNKSVSAASDKLSLTGGRPEWHRSRSPDRGQAAAGVSARRSELMQDGCIGGEHVKEKNHEPQGGRRWQLRRDIDECAETRRATGRPDERFVGQTTGSPFRFNSNLPSPRQVLRETGRQQQVVAGEDVKMAERSERRESPPVESIGKPSVQSTGRLPHQGDYQPDEGEEEEEEGKRLSLYENADEQLDPSRATGKPADDEWSVEGSAGDRESSADLTAMSVRKLASQFAAGWAPANQNWTPRPPVESADDSSPSSGRRRPERKLVAMTSIIQEPEDDLMNRSVTASSSLGPLPRLAGQEAQVATGGLARQRVAELRDSALSLTGNNNSDSDSSLAAASASRRRLVRKFEQLGGGSQPEAPQQQQVRRPSASRGPVGGSLVRRLAGKFDQTVQEQQQVAAGPSGSGRWPPRASLEEEPKSDSTWYDAKSIELLDEAEVAELLRELDGDEARAYDATLGSASAGPEAYVSLADSTLASHEPGRRDERRDEDEHDDDDTLNDGDDGEEELQLDEHDDGQVADEPASESVYASAMGTAPATPPAAATPTTDRSAAQIREKGKGARRLVSLHTAAPAFACFDENGDDDDDDGVASESWPTDGDQDDDSGLLIERSREISGAESELQESENERERLENGPGHLSGDIITKFEACLRASMLAASSSSSILSKLVVLSDDQSQELEPEGGRRQDRDHESDGEGQDENEGSGLEARHLFEAAKKCSRLYDELDWLLARRRGRRQSQQGQQVASRLLGGEQDGGGADDDQISLSSSSLSSESVPVELKHRRNLQKLYHIVNEIYTSEAKFVATLRLLNVDFRQHIFGSEDLKDGYNNNNNNSNGKPNATDLAALNELKLAQQPPYDCVANILKHLPQLQVLNEQLLEEFHKAREQWPRTQKISHVLVKIGPFLKHYSSYIRELETNQQQYQENLKKFPHFAQHVRRFESQEKCQKLTVQHQLLKPIQRIPQYRLLLQHYLNHLKPDDRDYEDTVRALGVVSGVAEHANQSLKETSRCIGRRGLLSNYCDGGACRLVCLKGVGGERSRRGHSKFGALQYLSRRFQGGALTRLCLRPQGPQEVHLST